jgi:acyl carrier protein
MQDVWLSYLGLFPKLLLGGPIFGIALIFLSSITGKQMEKLIKELQVKIVEVLNLIDAQPEDIGADEQLVGGKLGIDSIDVLEMVIMIEKDYGVKIDNRELGVKVFATLGTLADYIHKSSPELPN